MRNMKKGFTLVELIVVIVILAILATIAFISLRDYPVQARDSKRISEIGALADKANIVIANDPTKFSKLITGTTGNPSVTWNNASVTATIGNIDYTVLGETEFTAPLADEKYKMIIMTWTTTGGESIKCFEIWAAEEKTSTGVFTKGNCGIYVTNDIKSLFSRTPGEVLK